MSPKIKKTSNPRKKAWLQLILGAVLAMCCFGVPITLNAVLGVPAFEALPDWLVICIVIVTAAMGTVGSWLMGFGLHGLFIGPRSNRNRT